jgi:hypothetical protein
LALAFYQKSALLLMRLFCAVWVLVRDVSACCHPDGGDQVLSNLRTTLKLFLARHVQNKTDKYPATIFGVFVVRAFIISADNPYEDLGGTCSGFMFNRKIKDYVYCRFSRSTGRHSSS